MLLAAARDAYDAVAGTWIESGAAAAAFIRFAKSLEEPDAARPLDIDRFQSALGHVAAHVRANLRPQHCIVERRERVRQTCSTCMATLSAAVS